MVRGPSGESHWQRDGSATAKFMIKVTGDLSVGSEVHRGTLMITGTLKDAGCCWISAVPQSQGLPFGGAAHAKR